MWTATVLCRPFSGRTLVAGQTFALVEDFHDLPTEAYLELLLDQGVGTE